MQTYPIVTVAASLVCAFLPAALHAQETSTLVPVFEETFDSGETAETASPVLLSELGWSVHHSYAGVLIDGLEVAPDTVLSPETTTELGDFERGEPYGYVAFYIGNYANYGEGTEESRLALPGPHPETGLYYHNRTLALMLWKEHTLTEEERGRLQAFTFVQGNRDASKHTFMPAVRIDGHWYVYQVDQERLGTEVRVLGRPGQTDPNGAETVFHGDQFSQEGAYANYYNAQPYHFPWSETGWTPLTFDGTAETSSTVGMALGEPMEGALPAGQITALGVYAPENIVDPYNFNGHRIDSIALMATPPPPVDLFTFTFNNEGTVDGLDRPIQASTWNGIYSGAALPLVTGEAVMADLSEGVSADPTPGHYKAGFLFVTGRNDQPAPEGFFVYSTNTLVVSEPQVPLTGINPQVDWHSDAPNSVKDLSLLAAQDIRELTMRIRPRNAETVRYHFALRLGGEWLVSEEGFQYPQGATDWVSVSLDAVSANWLSGVVGETSLNLDFVANPPGVTTLAALGEVLLDRVGIYIDTDDAVGTNNTWARVDSITLSAVVPPLDPPEITAQPESRIVDEGDSVSLAVTVADAEGVTYQWRKDGVALAEAIEATLTLDNLLPADSGDYTVVVTGPGGDVISEPATLTVRPKPTVTPDALTLGAEASDQLLTVDAVSGVEWTAEADVDWIVITYGQSGSGSDLVMFSVAANESLDERTGTLLVAGVSVPVTQAGAEPEPLAFEEIVTAGANDRGGWTSDWFGDFWIDLNGWIYHQEMGWLWVGLVEDTDNMVIYSLTLDGWVWTSELYFNTLYEFNRGGYILYFIGTGGRVFLFDYSILDWIEL